MNFKMNLRSFKGKSMLWDFNDFSSPIYEVCGQIADMDKMWEKFGGTFYVFASPGYHDS